MARRTISYEVVALAWVDLQELIRAVLLPRNCTLQPTDKGFTVCAYNRTVSKVDDFMNNEAKGESIERASLHRAFIVQPLT